MLFVCDRDGPVLASEIGLPNNPESEHGRDKIERHVQTWNLANPDRFLKIFEAEDRFPIERWDPDLFDLLPFVQVEAGAPSGPGGDIVVNGDVLLDGTLRDNGGISLSGYLEDGTPFYTKYISIGTFTGNQFGPVAHGIPGLVTNERIIHAHGQWRSVESGVRATYWSGYDSAAWVMIHQIRVSDTDVSGTFTSIVSPFAHVYVCIEYI